jgi:hypothetical protein
VRSGNPLRREITACLLITMARSRYTGSESPALFDPSLYEACGAINGDPLAELRHEQVRTLIDLFVFVFLDITATGRIADDLTRAWCGSGA